MTLATQDELVEFIKGKNGLFNFEEAVIVPFLDFAHAEAFLKEGVTEEDWEKLEGRLAYTEENILKEMGEYMEFAWTKVEDHRGLSAIRSIQKMQAYCKMLGADDLIEFSEADGNYSMYGAPTLNAICERYGFPIPEGEQLARMIQGLPCRDDCREGCN